MATQLAFWDSPATDGETHSRSAASVALPPPTAPVPATLVAEPSEIVSDSQTDVLQRLRQQLDRLETGPAGRPHPKTVLPPVSCGGAVLDRLLPRGGLPAASMIEWIAACPGGGARLLAMLSAAEILRRQQGWLVVVDAAGTFYPPAAWGLGIDAERIVWVRPADRSDQVWAIDQALRCSAVAAVWSPVGGWLDDRDARRFQLAAEHGNTMGLFVRPAMVMGQPSFAEIRWHVQATRLQNAARGRPLRATLARCRGGQIGRSVTFAVTEHGITDVQASRSASTSSRPTVTTIDSGSTVSQASVHLAAQLAHPKVARRRKHSA